MLRIARLVLLLGFMPGVVLAGPQVLDIKVDLAKGTLSPGRAVVNMWEQQRTVSIRVGKKPEGSKVIKAYPTVPLGKWNGISARSFESLAADDSSQLSATAEVFFLTFERCKNAVPCPSAVEAGVNAWTVFSRTSTLGFIIRYASDGAENQIITIPVEVVSRPFDLRWSAGFSFFDRSDYRYRLETIEGDPESSALSRVSDDGNPYQLSAFAHYAPFKADWLSLTAGLATDVPVENFSIMVGASLSARVLPIKDSGYLSFGVAYSKAARLKAEFEGLTSVPVDTKIENLLEDRYGLGFFVGLSFGFLGGEKEFKSYPGSSKAEN